MVIVETKLDIINKIYKSGLSLNQKNFFFTYLLSIVEDFFMISCLEKKKDNVE